MFKVTKKQHQTKYRYRFRVSQMATQGMRYHECSGCTNPQIFGTSPFAPANFEASSTMCTC